jgi:selenocysteine-specific translation elongation factor
MPIPSKNENEDKQKFIARCMGDEVMKKDYPDSKQRVSICIGQSKKNKSSLIEDVHDELLANNCTWDDEWNEFVWEVEATEIFDEDGRVIAAEKNGRKVTLNKPFRTPDGPKKSSVYVKNDKGNIVKVNFGDPDMKIKKNIPERRRSFRARHNCENPGPKWKARYWSCKAW